MSEITLRSGRHLTVNRRQNRHELSGGLVKHGQFHHSIDEDSAIMAFKDLNSVTAHGFHRNLNKIIQFRI